MANYHKYAAAVILAGALQANVAQAQINNVIDCGQIDRSNHIIALTSAFTPFWASIYCQGSLQT